MKPEKISLYQVRDFGEVLNASFAFIAKHYRVLGLAFLQWCLPFVLLSTLTSMLFTHLFYEWATEMGKNPWTILYWNLSETVIQKFLLFSLLSLVVGWLLAASIMLVLFKVFKLELDESTDIDLNAINKGFFRGMAQLFTAQMFYYLMLMIGFALFLLPGLYWTFLLLLLPIISYFEPENTFWRGYKRCKELYRSEGRFSWQKYFQTVGLVLVISIISVSVSAFLTALYQGVGYSPFESQNVVNGEPPAWWIVIITNLISHTANALMGFLNFTVLTFQYFSLVEQSDGKSIAQEIEQFGR